ncbi:MAG: MoaD/ThiS family protein [Thaumarchaeota archaeon]|nr:MoaD/ThiS family protein [Nitrososphaerota archaeon]
MDGKSKIKVFVASIFAKEFKLSRELTMEVGTVEDLVSNIENMASGFRDSIYDETGTIRPYVNVFVDGANISSREDALNTPLKDGDSVYIFPSVAGG